MAVCFSNRFHISKEFIKPKYINSILMDELLKRIHQLEVAVQNERRKNELLEETTSFLQKQLKVVHRDRFELEHVPYGLLDEITKRMEGKSYFRMAATCKLAFSVIENNREHYWKSIENTDWGIISLDWQPDSKVLETKLKRDIKKMKYCMVKLEINSFGYDKILNNLLSLIKESAVRVITLKMNRTILTNEMFYYLKPKNLEIMGFMGPFTAPYILDIVKIDCDKKFTVRFPGLYLINCKMLYVHKLTIFCHDYHLQEMSRIKRKHLVRFESTYVGRFRDLEGQRIYCSHEDIRGTTYLYLLPITTSEGKLEVSTVFTYYEQHYYIYCQYLTIADEVNHFFDFIRKSHKFLSPALIQDVQNLVQSYVMQ